MSALEIVFTLGVALLTLATGIDFLRGEVQSRLIGSEADRTSVDTWVIFLSSRVETVVTVVRVAAAPVEIVAVVAVVVLVFDELYLLALPAVYSVGATVLKLVALSLVEA